MFTIGHMLATRDITKAIWDAAIASVKLVKSQRFHDHYAYLVRENRYGGFTANGYRTIRVIWMAAS